VFARHHRSRDPAQHWSAGRAVTKGGLEGLPYTTPAAPDNSAIVEHHITGLIPLTPRGKSDRDWLMILDGKFFADDFVSPHGFWIWVKTDHLTIGGYPKFRRMVREKYGLDFEPMTEREWRVVMGHAFYKGAFGCWDAS
jgi:hypothetical protein